MEVLRFVAGCLMAYTGGIEGVDTEAGIIQQFHIVQQESFKIKRGTASCYVTAARHSIAVQDLNLWLWCVQRICSQGKGFLPG